MKLMTLISAATGALNMLAMWGWRRTCYLVGLAESKVLPRPRCAQENDTESAYNPEGGLESVPVFKGSLDNFILKPK